LSTLPRCTDAAQIEQLIATCRESTLTGSRDRAILLLIARLGFRGSEVVSSPGQHRCPGKRRRETGLALPQDAGDALLAYLEGVRPHFACDRDSFVLNAPVRPITAHNVVESIVRRALRKAAISSTQKGTSGKGINGAQPDSKTPLIPRIVMCAEVKRSQTFLRRWVTLRFMKRQKPPAIPLYTLRVHNRGFLVSCTVKPMR
jgi:hypothetical protein